MSAPEEQTSEIERDDSDDEIDSIDRSLLQRIAENRDKAAFGELYERHQRAALSLARHLTRDPDAAEETFQEGMLRVWRYAHTYKGSGQVRSWLLRIVALEGLKMINARRRDRARQESVPVGEAEDARDDRNLDPERKELLEGIGTAVKALPFRSRQLLALYYGADLSQKEIGQSLGVPQYTISRRLEEVLNSIRQRLSAAGLATALPWAEADGISTSITSGASAPERLTDAVMARLDEPVEMPVDVQANQQVSSWKARALLATGFVVAIGIGIAVLLSISNRSDDVESSVASPQTALESPVEPVFSEDKKAPEPRFYRKWRFDDGPRSDFIVMKGNWKWRRVSETKVGEMVAPGEGEDETVALITEKIPSRPLLVILRGRVLSTKGLISMGVNLAYDETPIHPELHRSWRTAAEIPEGLDFSDRPSGPLIRSKGGRLVFWCIIFEDLKINVMEGFPFQVRNIGPDGVCGALSQYGKSYPGNRIACSVGNATLEEVEARELLHEELPKILKDADALREDIRTKGRKHK